jgi:agmatine deiminase
MIEQTIYFSELLQMRHPELFAELTSILSSFSVPWQFIPGTKDIWCRDYMPVGSSNGRMIKFRYDPPYLRSKRWRETVTHPEDYASNLPLKDIHLSDLTIDGGMIVKSVANAIITDKVYSWNRGIQPKFPKIITMPCQGLEYQGYLESVADAWSVRS